MSAFGNVLDQCLGVTAGADRMATVHAFADVVQTIDQPAGSER